MRVEFRFVSSGFLKARPQYTILKDDGKTESYNEDFLTWLENNGWELVSVTAPSGHQFTGGASTYEIMWFKKLISE